MTLLKESFKKELIEKVMKDKKVSIKVAKKIVRSAELLAEAKLQKALDELVLK